MGIIKLKRGTTINFGGITLEAGEPAFVLDSGKLYIGDGTNKILINPDQANAEIATKLQTARLIGVAGDGTGSASFDGSANVSITLVLANTGVGAGKYTKVTVDTKGRITSATNLIASDIPTLTLSKISDAGTVASKNTGTTSGTIPILDVNGKLDSSILPAIAISDTFVVATQVAMLALTAEIGDISVRTDLNKSYILKTTGASTLANWQELLTPTDSVASVAGKTGTVTLTSTDVGLANVTNTSDANKPVSTAQQTAFNLKANLNSPSLTGIPVAPTATAGVSTTQVATTAFVTTAVTNKTTITGNAGTATTLATARTITLAGQVTGSVSFNGSANVSITTIIETIDGGTF